ncbi:MAG: hypothetical protein AAFW01_05510 [Pseudomonadota bacterium]
MNEDYWVDLRALEVAGALQAAAASARERASAEDRVALSLGLPGIELAVDGVGRLATAALTNSFAHLSDVRPPPGATRLTWTIVDGRLVGDGAPPVPPAPGPLGRYGTLHHDLDRTVLIERRHALTTSFDPVRGELISLTEDPGQIDNDVLAKPLLRFLFGQLWDAGFATTHAALIGRNGRGMLITGRGGAGKSTITAAALAAGFDVVADDFVAVSAEGGGFVGQSLYASLLLDAERSPAAQLHAGRLRPARPGSELKALLPIFEHFPGQIAERLTIDAVAVPRITSDAGSSLEPLSQAAAARALLPSSVLSAPGREAERAPLLFDVVASVPSFSYLSGADPEGIGQPLERFLG